MEGGGAYVTKLGLGRRPPTPGLSGLSASCTDDAGTVTEPAGRGQGGAARCNEFILARLDPDPG